MLRFQRRQRLQAVDTKTIDESRSSNAALKATNIHHLLRVLLDSPFHELTEKLFSVHIS